jgi:hypothetical protein
MASKNMGVNGKTLLAWLDNVGWDKGITILEAEHRRLENIQANLFADPETVHRAAAMSPILLKQDETLIALHRIMEEKGISGVK